LCYKVAKSPYIIVFQEDVRHVLFITLRYEIFFFFLQLMIH